MLILNDVDKKVDQVQGNDFRRLLVSKVNLDDRNRDASHVFCGLSFNKQVHKADIDPV